MRRRYGGGLLVDCLRVKNVHATGVYAGEYLRGRNGNAFIKDTGDARKLRS
jgi:hypothetical protein